VKLGDEDFFDLGEGEVQAIEAALAGLDVTEIASFRGKGGNRENVTIAGDQGLIAVDWEPADQGIIHYTLRLTPWQDVRASAVAHLNTQIGTGQWTHWVELEVDGVTVSTERPSGRAVATEFIAAVLARAGLPPSERPFKP